MFPSSMVSRNAETPSTTSQPTSCPGSTEQRHDSTHPPARHRVTFCWSAGSDVASRSSTYPPERHRVTFCLSAGSDVASRGSTYPPERHRPAFCWSAGCGAWSWGSTYQPERHRPAFCWSAGCGAGSWGSRGINDWACPRRAVYSRGHKRCTRFHLHGNEINNWARLHGR